jgi:formylglycine-generating enzyme required for sulfatase activity
VVCLLALLAPLLAILPSASGEDKQDKDKTITNSIGMKLTPIPAGKFQMGSPAAEAERDEIELRHEVEISKPFHVGVYEVTQGQWKAVMGNNPSHFRKNGGGKDSVKQFEEKDLDDFPVERVSHDDVRNFLAKLNAKAEEKKAGRTYRLPTEAEWEYCCRAGTDTPFHYGKSLSGKEADFNGNFPYGGAEKGDYLRRTSKVGSYKPNKWGLYDMHGNVQEWCADFYDPDYYKNSPKKDPTGPEKGVVPTGYKNRNTPGVGQWYRVIRGGSWLDEARGCRSAYRFRAMPNEPYHLIGFRVVCEVKES